MSRLARDGRHSRGARVLTLAATLLIVGGALAGTRAGWLAAKATLAQHLLERAWRETHASGVPTAPWPWADITPRARLEVPGADLALVVLQDASGEAMAFGPGLVAGVPERAARTAVALGGHRDSHLAFLEHLPVGAPLVLEDRNGVRHAYRLADKRVVDTRDGPLAVPTDRPSLLLITCWPFHASQTGGPLRMVAVALPRDEPIAILRACATPPWWTGSTPTAARTARTRGRCTTGPSRASPPATT